MFLRTTTALLFGLFASSLRVTSREDNRPKTEARFTNVNSYDSTICTLTNNPLLKSDFFTPAWLNSEAGDLSANEFITQDSIKPFVSAPTPEIVAEVTEIFYNSQYIHPAINHYLQLIFKSLEGFSIAVYPFNDIQKIIPNLDAQYFYTTRTLVLPCQYNEIDSTSLYKYVLHEARHAAMHTMQLLLGNVDESNKLDCHFPDSPTEYNKVLAMAENGHKKIKAYGQLFLDQANGNLNEDDQLKLDQLKKQFPARKEYKQVKTLELNNSQIIHIEKNLRQKLKVGITINLDKELQVALGNIEIQEINQTATGIELTFLFLEPLVSMTYIVPKMNEFIQKRKGPYLSYQHLYELDAHLHEKFPQELIQFFYPEFYVYTQELLHKTSALNRIYPVTTSSYISFKEFYLESCITFITHNKLYRDEDIQFYIGAVRFIFINGKYDAAKIGLLHLINVGKRDPNLGVEIGRMYENLGTASYHLNDYSKAITYYQIAKNYRLTGATTPPNIQDFYEEAQKKLAANKVTEPPKKLRR